MTTLAYLQNYWWLLISVLGAVLVFLLFVQGGQSMLLSLSKEDDRTVAVNLLGRKWELTFTTLVVFGGAFFASFPLFYSTSFGGAYWLWMLILLSFVLQAVSYEFRRKPGNLLGRRTYDTFLFINGCMGCILLGVAVAMFFFGAEFTVVKANILDTGAPVISKWTPTHGLEAIFCWKNLVLGVTVLFLARTQACLYMINRVDSSTGFYAGLRNRVLINGGIFVVFFLAFVALLLTTSGQTIIEDAYGTRTVEIVDFKYLHNYLTLWWTALALVVGVVLVLYALIRTVASPKFHSGIWYCGIGTILVVLSLFWVAGYADTAFYPSLLDPQSSLTIRNSSSSEFTLKTMSIVSIIIPFVAAYIIYAWRSMDKKKINSEELTTDHHY